MSHVKAEEAWSHVKAEEAWSHVKAEAWSHVKAEEAWSHVKAEEAWSHVKAEEAWSHVKEVILNILSFSPFMQFIKHFKDLKLYSQIIGYNDSYRIKREKRETQECIMLSKCQCHIFI